MNPSNPSNQTPDWYIFRRENIPHSEIDKLPPPPSWRKFSQISEHTDTPKTTEEEKRGQPFQARDEEIELINAAIYLRRPLLVEGKPGTGKTTIAYAIAYQLQLGSVLRWDINTRSELKDGLYDYDAIGRLQDIKVSSESSPSEPHNHPHKTSPQEEDIGKYITLGPLGTAMYSQTGERPRVLLIDEIDKSDIDLPNDLLNVLEDGSYKIPELVRHKADTVTVTTYDERAVSIQRGKVDCEVFPIVILTSNGERDFPPAFLRRCIRLNMPEPSRARLNKIVQAHFQEEPQIFNQVKEIIDGFYQRRQKEQLATDQLLNAIYLVVHRQFPNTEDKQEFVNKILQNLTNTL